MESRYIKRAYTRLQDDVLRAYFKRPDLSYKAIADTAWCSEMTAWRAIQKLHINDLMDRQSEGRLELTVNVPGELI